MSNLFNYNHLGMRMENATFARTYPVGTLLTAIKDHWCLDVDNRKATGQLGSSRGHEGEAYLILEYWSDIGEYGVTCLRVRDNQKVKLNSAWCNTGFSVSRPDREEYE